MRSYQSVAILIIVGFLLLSVVAVWFLFDLGIFFPPTFEGSKTIVIKQGENAGLVAEDLYREALIRNRGDFILFMRIFRFDRRLTPGTYRFDKPISVPSILSRITNPFSERAIRVQEGWTIYEIGRYLEHEGLMPKDIFIKAAEGNEGYLFPDTYRIFENITPKELVILLHQTFETKTTALREETIQKKKNFKEIIIMASLIEKEAAGPEDRKIISGILWKRLREGVALRVDATLSYLTGKSSKELTTTDLAMDSPYNTYRYKGLPPQPIGNSGLGSIDAALHPVETQYWYYLHDPDGNPHYAVTFEEHIANKNKYLR